MHICFQKERLIVLYPIEMLIIKQSLRTNMTKWCRPPAEMTRNVSLSSEQVKKKDVHIVRGMKSFLNVQQSVFLFNVKGEKLAGGKIDNIIYLTWHKPRVYVSNIVAIVPLFPPLVAIRCTFVTYVMHLMSAEQNTDIFFFLFFYNQEKMNESWPAERSGCQGPLHVFFIHSSMMFTRG